MSEDGCIKCDFTGTINTFKWVEDDTYPIPREVASIELCSCVKERQFLKFDATAGFSHEQKQHTFKNAIIDDYNKSHFHEAVDFIKHIETNLEEGTWLYIFGDELRAEEATLNDPNIRAYGTGKSYLMDCIANALSNRRIPGLYVTEEILYGDIKASYNRNSEETEFEVLEKYYNVPVLLIDDIFTAPYTNWAEGKLFSILDERQKKKKITIMTSNYAEGRIRSRLPVNGAKIASRIVGQAIMIEMLGPDRREEKAKKRKREVL